MDELKEENAALKRTVQDLREEVASLRTELEALEIQTLEGALKMKAQEDALKIEAQEEALKFKAQEEALKPKAQEDALKIKAQEEALKIKMQEVLQVKAYAQSQDDQQQQQHQQQQAEEQEQQHEIQLPEMTPTMANKYVDLNYLSDDERKDIKFVMASMSLSPCKYNDGKPARFCDFQREPDDNLSQKFDGLTGTRLGTFVTPIAGRYRFDVRGGMGGNGKAQWYICCAPKKDDIYSKLDDCSDDGDDGNEDEWELKRRIFDAKTRRQPLFIWDTEVDSEEKWHEGSVGMDCEKGILVWIDLVILQGEFDRGKCACLFQGRYIC